MYNATQILLAILGLAGVGLFVLIRLRSPDDPKKGQSGCSLPILMIGLSAWLGLALMRADVVAATGMVIALALLWRHYRR